MNVKLIVEAVVAVIIALAVVTPIVSGLGEEVHSVSYNTGEKYALVVEDHEIDNIVITMDPANGKYMINGVVRDVPAESTTYVLSDKFSLRYNGNQIYGLFENTSPIIQTTEEVALSIEDGAATISYGGNTYNQGAVEFLFYPNEDGEYGCFSAGEVNVNSSEAAYALLGPQYATGDYNMPYIISKVVDGQQEMIVGKYNANGTITALSASTLNFTYDVIDDFHAEYNISNISFTISGSDYTKAVIIFTPIEYSYLSDNDAITSTLVGLIPVLLVVGIIVLVVYGSVLRRD